MEEELRLKFSQQKRLKDEVRDTYPEICGDLSFVRYLAVIRIINQLRKKQHEDMMRSHVNKLTRLLSKQFDVHEHINNLSSYRLSFFEKLVICRGLKFFLPQKISPIEIQASFEKAYWVVEPLLTDSDSKELTSATLRSIALNYIERKSPDPAKALVEALNSLKKRDDIVITKPDKGSGVVIMDRDEYNRLLSEASVDNTSKFVRINEERAKTRGRPPTHYHPLLQKEKELTKILNDTLPDSVATSLRPRGTRLAHLYGLPKTHKSTLCMRPIKT